MDKKVFSEENCGSSGGETEILLDVQDLVIGFPNSLDYHGEVHSEEVGMDNGRTEDNKLKSIRVKGDLRKDDQVVVKNISFQIKPGEILGIVGESGSGKSMTALAILQLLSEEANIYGGKILFQGEDLFGLDEKELAKVRGDEIAMIFQEPMTSLNPVMKIGAQIEEMLFLHNKYNGNERKEKVMEALLEVGLDQPEKISGQYPHELSGGMRQRVMIAMAMICKPKLLIADEPTTALDVTIQLQILELIKRMNQKYNTSVLFISHDLGVIKSICHRTLVMNQGEIIESGSVSEVLSEPKEDYTKKLIHSIPSVSSYREHGNQRETENENRVIIQSLEENKSPSTILEVRDLEVGYSIQKKGFFSKKERKQVVNRVSFAVKEGEILGIVGESGSGKSTLVKAIAGLIQDKNGSVILNGLKPKMVFQDPYGSLNPVKKIGWILEEPLRISGNYSKAERRERVLHIMKEVGLPEHYLNRYPSQLSGGQRQRVSIASALIGNSKLILLDEPVSALDVTIQGQILELILRLRDDYGLTYLFISHDLNVIRQVCDRVCIMYRGEVIEQGIVEEIFNDPQQDYTKKLLDAIL